MSELSYGDKLLMGWCHHCGAPYAEPYDKDVNCGFCKKEIRKAMTDKEFEEKYKKCD